MKEKLSAFFRHQRFGKNRRISLIFTIVALVEIFAIMVVSTSAWVESISSIKIYTTYDASSNSSGTKGTVENMIMNRASLVSNNSDNIDLRNYFRQSGGYHLCGASSVDGNTMFFPEIKGGSTSNYRIGNVNDKNVNYISFTIKTNTAVALAFDTVPTISFGDTELSDDNRKLVRFSIGDNAGNYRVYSLYPSEFTENVPAAENGATQSTTVYPFASYLKGVNKAVTTTENGYLSFNMWIQDPTGDSSSVYHNKALTVSDLQLVTVIPVTLKSTHTDNSDIFREGTATTFGGTVAITNSGTATGNEVYAYQTVYYAAPGQTIYCYAKASETNGYWFLGFKTSSPVGSSSTDVTSSNNPYAYAVASDATSVTLWAMFSNVHNIYMKPEYQHGSAVRYAAYVFGVDSSGTTQGNWYSMASVTSGTFRGSYSCTYRGSATSVIFCYMDPNTPNTEGALNELEAQGVNVWNTYRLLQTYDLTVPSKPGDYLYIVTCRQVLNGITANGTTYVNTRNAAINDTEGDPHNYGTNKLLGYWDHNNASVTVGYTLNSDFSESNTGTYSASDSYKPKICASLTDTCRYYTNAYWYNDEKSVTVDGKAYQDIDDNGDLIPQYKYEKKVTLTAATISTCDFAGWYDNAAGTGTALSTSPTYEITAPDNGNYTGANITNGVTYYAKYTKKPNEYYLKALWNSWSEVQDQLTGTGNELTFTQELDPGQYEFKIYDGIDVLHWSNAYTYKYKYSSSTDTYLGASGGDTLNSNNSTANMKFKVGYTGSFVFHFNKSTKKFWITATDVTTYHVAGTITGSWDAKNTNKMTKVSTYEYTYLVHVANSSKTFKIRTNSGTYYGNGKVYHDGYFGASGGDTLTTSGDNMTMTGSGKDYVFHFNTNTEKFWITWP